MKARDESRDYFKKRTECIRHDNPYLKRRIERIRRDNPYLKKRMKEIQKKIDKAIEEPSETCKDGTEHNFVLLSHVDTKEEAIYYFCCDKCDEVVKATQVRIDDDPMRY